MSTNGLLTLVLLAPLAANPSPPPQPVWRLNKGDELIYSGNVTESIDRPGNRLHRAHDLEIRVFVLERGESWADVAVLTLLRRTNDTVSGAVSVVTGGSPNRVDAPPVTRLDLVRIYEDGTVHLLTPTGPPPLKLDRNAPVRVVPAIPLDTFSPCEFGMFPPRPPRPDRSDQPWTVASADPARPPQAWHVKGLAFVEAERCALVAMNQHSPDWEKPQGGQTSWHRADAVWVSTQDGTARRVHRVIQQRDGISPNHAVRIEVKYELRDQSHLIGRAYSRSRQDVEVAYSTATEIAPFLPEAARRGPQLFATRLAKLDAYVEESATGTPYREAVLAVRRQLDAARRGETGPRVIPTVTAAPSPIRDEGATVGKTAPEIQTGAFRLTERRGKPVILIFFRPGSETTDLSLAVAEALRMRYGSRAEVVPLVVFGDIAAAMRDRDRLKLTASLHDGSGVTKAYGIETFPRFMVIDPSGTIRWTFAGVGAETGYLIRQEVDQILTPSPGTAPPAGTSYQSDPRPEARSPER